MCLHCRKGKASLWVPILCSFPMLWQEWFFLRHNLYWDSFFTVFFYITKQTTFLEQISPPLFTSGQAQGMFSARRQPLPPLGNSIEEMNIVGELYSADAANTRKAFIWGLFLLYLPLSLSCKMGKSLWCHAFEFTMTKVMQLSIKIKDNWSKNHWEKSDTLTRFQ